ncbi:hypothetical protein FRAAL3852 [Frankia alni ACN14a]|uniref:Uncharacterized protein n=1 Tax=Frankia alni (strain DSM 45986 / CECT 9034 / ACN14a) TaxID=326424 RepID=Q0RJ20_FRAAA|nr:hypothetical protein FRAAL3852 [Frankia alni ACN14a]
MTARPPGRPYRLLDSVDGAVPSPGLAADDGPMSPTQLPRGGPYLARNGQPRRRCGPTARTDTATRVTPGGPGVAPAVPGRRGRTTVCTTGRSHLAGGRPVVIVRADPDGQRGAFPRLLPQVPADRWKS